MSLQWNPWALPALLLFGGLGALALLVYRNEPRRLQTRLLALTLVANALAWLAVGYALSATQGPHAYAAWITNDVFLVVHLVTYLGFLGTLPTPISRPFRTRAGRWALAAAAVVGAAFILGRTGHLYPRVIDPAEGVPLWARTGAGPTPWWSTTRDLLSAGVFLFGALVAVQYVRMSTPGTPSRSQAKIYLAGFGTRDILVTAGHLISGSALVATPILHGPVSWLSFWIGEAVGLTLITYGFLKYRLLDIDLKIKRGVSRSSVAGVFVAVFFVVSEGAQLLFAEFAGSETLGVLAAGALVFFLAPLQRLGERVGDAAMPGVEDTEEYREKRKREVYRATLEELHADEEVTAKERRTLGRLQEELGLGGDEAGRIEAEVLEGGGEAA